MKSRSRYAFWFFTIASGAWWIWAAVMVSRFRVTQPTYDWATPGFGNAFAVYILLNVAFQVNYLYLYVGTPVTLCYLDFANSGRLGTS